MVSARIEMLEVKFSGLKYVTKSHGRDTGRLSGELVVPDRQQHLTRRRVHQSQDDRNHEQEHRHHQEEIVALGEELEAKDDRRRDRAHPERAAGHALPVTKDQEGDLTNGNGTEYRSTAMALA
jgi:hypothetical protein